MEKKDFRMKNHKKNFFFWKNQQDFGFGWLNYLISLNMIS